LQNGKACRRFPRKVGVLTAFVSLSLDRFGAQSVDPSHYVPVGTEHICERTRQRASCRVLLGGRGPTHALPMDVTYTIAISLSEIRHKRRVSLHMCISEVEGVERRFREDETRGFRANLMIHIAETLCKLWRWRLWLITISVKMVLCVATASF
jgi:hypothetical protein